MMLLGHNEKRWINLICSFKSPPTSSQSGFQKLFEKVFETLIVKKGEILWCTQFYQINLTTDQTIIELNN